MNTPHFLMKYTTNVETIFFWVISRISINLIWAYNKGRENNQQIFKWMNQHGNFRHRKIISNKGRQGSHFEMCHVRTTFSN